MNSLREGIFISPVHWLDMEADVKARAPEEACGMLLGEQNRVKVVFPVTNSLHSRTKFQMEPGEQLKGFILAEKSGQDILAIYHSHPLGIDHPSETDHNELTYPGVVYLIWFQKDGTWKCRGFLMNAKDNSFEVPVIIAAC